MWIRSQDKTELMDINYIRAYKDTIKGFNVVNDVVLGVYSTAEKALKVMDMLEDEINNCYGIFSYDGFGTEHFNGNIYTHYNRVYQMPQDNEV